MTSIVSLIALVLVDRVLNDRSVNWPHANRRNYP